MAGCAASRKLGALTTQRKLALAVGNGERLLLVSAIFGHSLAVAPRETLTGRVGAFGASSRTAV